MRGLVPRRALWILGLLAAAGCGPVEAPTAPPAASRLLVLGIDGLDPDMLDRQVAADALPTFGRLYREGAVGRVDVLATQLPLQSPRIWTTFATGQLPPVHGIATFVRVDASGDRRLYGSHDRKVPALWEIASQAGRRVGVVNWWATYPAEAVAGFVVSDRYVGLGARRLAEFWDADAGVDLGRSVAPPALLGRLRAIDAPEAVRPGSSPESAEVQDRYVLALAERAIAAQPVDLLLLYLRALDELSHMFWHTHAPLPGEPPPDADRIADYLQRLDALVAEAIALADADHVVVISDHGFERRDPGSGLPPGGHESAEAARGVLVVQGPRIRPGTRLGELSAVDVLPLLLELAALPAARDMPGRLPAGVFVAGDREPLARVARQRRLDGPAGGPGAGLADRETIERLRALGYLDEAPNPGLHPERTGAEAP